MNQMQTRFNQQQQQFQQALTQPQTIAPTQPQACLTCGSTQHNRKQCPIRNTMCTACEKIGHVQSNLQLPSIHACRYRQIRSEH